MSVADGLPHVYVIRSTGGTPRRLTNSSARESPSGWSRDGKWIYFSSDRSGEDERWKIRWGPEGAVGEAVQVTRKGGGDALESGDGRFVYYLQGDDPVTSLWRVPVSGGEEVRVVDKIWNFNFAIGDHGVYFIPETHATVQYLNFATGKVTTIATLAADPAYGFSLAPDERSLLFTQYEEHGSDLMLVENFH
jgi:dipeptidyl aminopeptidase/acylaminoacyl peptidase